MVRHVTCRGFWSESCCSTIHWRDRQWSILVAGTIRNKKHIESRWKQTGAWREIGESDTHGTLFLESWKPSRWTGKPKPDQNPNWPLSAQTLSRWCLVISCCLTPSWLRSSPIAQHSPTVSLVFTSSQHGYLGHLVWPWPMSAPNLLCRSARRFSFSPLRRFSLNPSAVKVNDDLQWLWNCSQVLSSQVHIKLLVYTYVYLQLCFLYRIIHIIPCLFAFRGNCCWLCRCFELQEIWINTGHWAMKTHVAKWLNYDHLVGGIPARLKNISQLGWLFPIYGKIKNVPNHQPVMHETQNLGNRRRWFDG